MMNEELREREMNEMLIPALYATLKSYRDQRGCKNWFFAAKRESLPTNAGTEQCCFKPFFKDPLA